MKRSAVISVVFSMFVGTALCAQAEQWTPIEPTSDSKARAIAVSGTDLYEASTVGFFRSSDGGLTWTAGGAGLPIEVVSLAVDPGALPPDLCDLPCVNPPGSLLYAGTGSGVYRSGDKGRSWRAMNAGLTNRSVSALAVAGTGVVYVATGGGVFKTSDYGVTWAPRSSGLECGARSLAAEPGSSSIIYAAGTGLCRSDDGGEHWVAKNNGLPDFSLLSLSLLSVAPVPGSGTVYVGTQWFGVFRSSDRGETWVPANAGLSGIAIPALAVDPFDPSTVYAGTGFPYGGGQPHGLGVFRSEDGGESWIPFSEGLPGNPTGRVFALAIDPSARNLYAALLGSGLVGPFLHRRTISEGNCSPAAVVLCLSRGRFRVEVSWRTGSRGMSGSGQAISLTTDTGAFWFFQPSNIELVVKVLDARSINGKFWVFYGALSNVEYTMTVTDTRTGAVKTYFNPEGHLASVADTAAF